MQNRGPASVYGADTLATMKDQERRLEVNDMRMLRQRTHEERYDQIRTCERISKVTPVAKKITEKRLRW